MRKTDKQIAAIYETVDPNMLAGATKKEWNAAVKETREALEAKTYEEAVEILTKYQWGEPERCARIIRGAKKCPTCNGSGYVEQTR